MNKTKRQSREVALSLPHLLIKSRVELYISESWCRSMEGGGLKCLSPVKVLNLSFVSD